MKPPITYFGGKTMAAPRIARLLPPHRHYVEPYAGSLAVLLAKDPAPHETVNDLDAELVTFWRVLRDRPAELERACALTPHARAEHRASYEPATDELETARRVWVQLTQGRGGCRTSTGWRHYVKPSGSTSMPRYLSGYLARFAPAVERLAAVSLECLPALDVIVKYGDHVDVLLYVDPPYLGESRAPGDATSRKRTARYLHEMHDEATHRELADVLHACRASVVLSGYHSDLYADLYADWNRTEWAAGTGQTAGTWANRTEVVWSNADLGGVL